VALVVALVWGLGLMSRCSRRIAIIIVVCGVWEIVRGVGGFR